MPPISQFFKSLPPVTKNLFWANLLVYLLMLIMPSDAVVYKYLAVHYFSSPLFNPAQLFTYMFVHGGFAHMFFNMFALLMFGGIIERALGSRRFLFYYISCGIGAALVQEGVYAIAVNKYAGMFSPADYQDLIRQGANAITQGMNFVDPTAAHLNSLVNGPVVGASGAIYGILLAFGMLFPNQTIYLLVPPMPVKAKYLVIGYAVLELALGVGNMSDNIAHFAHLGGMIFGLIIILYWKKKGTFNGYY